MKKTMITTMCLCVSFTLLHYNSSYAQETAQPDSIPQRDGILLPPGMDQFERLVVDDMLSLIRDYRTATRSSLLHDPGFVSSEPAEPTVGGGYMVIRRKVADAPNAIDECTVVAVDDRQYVHVTRRYPDGSTVVFNYDAGKCYGFSVKTSKEDGPIQIQARLSRNPAKILFSAPFVPGQEPNAVLFAKRWDKDWHASTVAAAGQTAIPLQAVRFYLKWREKWVKRSAELPKLPPEPKLAAPVTSYNWEEPWTKTAPPAETGK